MTRRFGARADEIIWVNSEVTRSASRRNDVLACNSHDKRRRKPALLRVSQAHRPDLLCGGQ